jgi:hypothetical protein
VDAIVTGGTQTVNRLLRNNPDLVRVRSRSKHHSTLLHYVVSNRVEAFRQKCPKNIVSVAELLLQAGAEVDAEADMYGGWQTTLRLAATFRAKVLPLLETLLTAGAVIEGPGGCSAVNACLGNGRPQAADFLPERGARWTSRADLGRIDFVKGLLNVDGSLKLTASATQMKDVVSPGPVSLAELTLSSSCWKEAWT